MNPKITTRWTWSERRYVYQLLDRKLNAGVIRDDIGDILTRRRMLKQASKFLLNARVEYMLKGLNVEQIPAIGD